MYYGYHRISTTQQHLDRGVNEIESYCKEHNIKLEKIFTDKISGKTFNRPRYTVLKEDVLRSGDTLIITEVDRLGRNKKAILQELRYFQNKHIRIMILELPTTLQDLSRMENNMSRMILETINNMLIELYAAMAQAELEKKTKRQREGIEAKKRRGEWDDYGRPRIKKPDNWDAVIKRWKDKEITAVAAMKELKLKKSTFYKMVKEYER